MGENLETCETRMIEEEDRFLDSGGEIDEDIEAMLYSQVHFAYDDPVGQETSFRETQLAFTVNSLSPVHSAGSLKSTSVKQSSVLFENVPFVSEGGAECEKCVVKSTTVDSKQGATVHEDSLIYLGKSKVGKRGANATQDNKPKFDMEAELGIHDSFPQTRSLQLGTWDTDIVLGRSDPSIKTKKGNKAKQDKDILIRSDMSLRSKKKIQAKQDKLDTVIRASTSQLPTLGTTNLAADFIQISKPSPIKENDYRKTLNQLLTRKPAAKKAKDIVVIKSDSSVITFSSTSSSSSTISSASELSDDVEIYELSSESDSESDIEVLGSRRADRSADKSLEPRLELNWNVTRADHQTIKRIEKESSQEDDSKWRIDDADMPSLSRSQMLRYYARKKIRCHNCDKEGHLSKVCPEAKKKPRCGLCGTEGHVMQSCKHSLCFNCNQPGHRGSNCPMPKRDLFARCARCQMKGHAVEHCPDLWRQYHLTVTSFDDLTPNRKAVNSNIFCCNCAKQGHFAHECWQERMDRFRLPASPFIMKYDCAVSKGTKGPFQTKSTDRESKQGLRTNKSQSDRHHSSTPQQSKAMYTPGSSSTSHRSEPGIQRYFNTQSSTSLTPHRLHPTPTSRRFTHIVDSKMQSSASTDQQQEASRHQYISPYTRKFLKGLPQEHHGGRTDHRTRRSGGEQYFDWHTEQNSHHLQGKSHKRQSPSTYSNNGLPPTKKKKSSKNKEQHTSQCDEGWARAGKKGHQQQRKGKARGEWNQLHQKHQSPDQAQAKYKNWGQHKSQQEKHKMPFSHPGTSYQQSQSSVTNKSSLRTSKQNASLPVPGTSQNQQRQSPTATSKGGFKTSVQARIYRNSITAKQRY